MILRRRPLQRCADRSATPQAPRTLTLRAMFSIYMATIVLGIAYFIVIGLAHH